MKNVHFHWLPFTKHILKKPKHHIDKDPDLKPKVFFFLFTVFDFITCILASYKIAKNIPSK